MALAAWCASAGRVRDGQSHREQPERRKDGRAASYFGLSHAILKIFGKFRVAPNSEARNLALESKYSMLDIDVQQDGRIRQDASQPSVGVGKETYIRLLTTVHVHLTLPLTPTQSFVAVNDMETMLNSHRP